VDAMTMVEDAMGQPEVQAMVITPTERKQNEKT
jgi:hypothetical protein